MYDHTINVARRNPNTNSPAPFTHYFRVVMKNVIFAEQAQEAAKDLRKRFPEAEGFKVTMTRQSPVFETVEIEP